MYAAILYLPLIMSGFILYYGWGYLTNLDNLVNSFALFTKPEAWYYVWLWYLLKWSLFGLVRVFAVIIAVLLANIFWAPVYEYISHVIEREITGKPAPEFNWKKQVALILEEAKKVAFILFVSLLAMAIPMVNVVAVLVTAFLVGWDFFDYVPARHGMSFAERRKLALANIFPIMGFGVWLVIPFVQFFVYPLGIAGGTLLSLEKLKLNTVDLKEVP